MELYVNEEGYLVISYAELTGNSLILGQIHSRKYKVDIETGLFIEVTDKLG